METRVDEIAERIYRLSTFLPAVGPSGLTFNQFLVDADEPLLFHCGQRALFPAVARAAARVLDLRRLRWIAFSHVEADECGALDQWLAAAPGATVTHGAIGCAIWLNDQAARAPRALADGEVLDLGGRRVQRLDTPHVPHCWDAGLLYEAATGTLFCSDLLTHVGDPPALLGRIAAEEAADLIIVGARVRGRLRRGLESSLARQLQTETRVPVLIAPPRTWQAWKPTS